MTLAAVLYAKKLDRLAEFYTTLGLVGGRVRAR